MLITEYLACPVCKSSLQQSDDENVVCLGCNRNYSIVGDIPVLLPDELSEFKQMEAQYHTLAVDQYAALNMIHSPRVRKYHEDFLRPIEQMPLGSLVFEVAGGDGTDALKLLQQGMKVVQTDISSGMVSAAKKMIAGKYKDSARFVVCDAENLPCKDSSLDAIIIVAALHHLPSPSAFFVEAHRALKTGGVLVIGFEPNTWQYKIVYPVLKKIRRLISFQHEDIQNNASIGDQEAKGFSLSQFKNFATQSCLDLEEVQRIWYLNGFIHTFLGHINARRGVSQQIDLPRFLQRLLIIVDNFISRIPLVRNFCWHWSIVLRKIEIKSTTP